MSCFSLRMAVATSLLCGSYAAINPFTQGCLFSKGLTKIKRACNSQDSVGSPNCTAVPLLISNKFPETRIHNGNWESSMFMAWVAQIISSEVMQLPSMIETGSAKATMDFYDVAASFGYGPAYGITNALVEANKDATCKIATNKGSGWKACAHAQLEIWSGQGENTKAGIAAGTLQHGGGNGMVGTMGWYISQFVVESEPSMATFHGLRDNSKTRKYLKKPLTWADYCNGTGNPAGVSWSPTGCNGTCATCKASKPPQSKPDMAKYATSKDNTTGYMGHFVDDGIGHVILPPCTWSSVGASQIYWNKLSSSINSSGTADASNGYTYSEMTQLYDASAWNKEGIMLWWWSPDSAMNRYTTDGMNYKMQRVILAASTKACVEARPWNHRCSANKSAQIGMEVNGGCDQDPEAHYKIFSKSLQTQNEPVYKFLSRLQITSDDSMEMLQNWRWSGLPDLWSVAPRIAVCNWVAKNYIEGANLKQYVTEGFPKTVKLVGITSGLTVILTILGSVGILINFGSFLWLVKYSNAPVVKLSQPLFLKLLLVGGALLNVLVILIGQPPSNLVCMLHPWIGHIGFLALVMPLLVKSWRVAVLFNNRKMTKKKITNKQLLRYIGSPLVVLIIYLAAMSFVGLPKPTIQNVGLTDAKSSIVTSITSCSSTNVGWKIAFAFDLLQLLWGVSLCVQTRSVSQDFAEAKYIGFGIYNTTIISIIAGGLVFGFELTPNREAGVVGACLWFASNFMVCIILLPKMLRPEHAVSELGRRCSFEHETGNRTTNHGRKSSTQMSIETSASSNSPSPSPNLAGSRRIEPRSPLPTLAPAGQGLTLVSCLSSALDQLNNAKRTMSKNGSVTKLVQQKLNDINVVLGDLRKLQSPEVSIKIEKANEIAIEEAAIKGAFASGN